MMDITYEPTATSAIEFVNADRLEEWVHLFLCGEGNNKAFSDGLLLSSRRYHAPKMMKLDDFGRCCGPEDSMKYQVESDRFFRHVDAIVARYSMGDWDMPPLIIEFEKGKYILNDGNHRYEALRKIGVEEYWVIVWETL